MNLSFHIQIAKTREEMGRAAAKCAAAAIRAVLAEKECANVIFAAAPSQNEMLAGLLREDLDFSRINALHMDEYVGLNADDPRSFAAYLTGHIFGKAPFRSVNLIPATLTPDEACAVYTECLQKYPVDVVCLGIGENGHIAFNDPPVADFHDPVLIKKVPLDPVCRMQQVHDGCFENLDQVPTHALTLTVPALLAARTLVCTVPSATKAAAVKEMLCGKIGTHCPASILRLHADCSLFLDKDSASELPFAEVTR